MRDSGTFAYRSPAQVFFVMEHAARGSWLHRTTRLQLLIVLIGTTLVCAHQGADVQSQYSSQSERDASGRRTHGSNHVPQPSRDDESPDQHLLGAIIGVAALIAALLMLLAACLVFQCRKPSAPSKASGVKEASSQAAQLARPSLEGSTGLQEAVQPKREGGQAAEATCSFLTLPTRHLSVAEHISEDSESGKPSDLHKVVRHERTASVQRDPVGTATGVRASCSKSGHVPKALARFLPADMKLGRSRRREDCPILEAPPQDAGAAQKQKYIHCQIDSLGRAPVLDGLILEQSGAGRQNGGQAVVQFAEQQSTGVEYAIKFFISQKFFQREQDMYMQCHSPLTSLGEFYPAVRNIVSNEEEAFVDAHGAPMPPCIIMEKGESLDLWRHRSKGLDRVAAVQVLYQVAERLEQLHSAGFCHRDLKPGNVMWLPRVNAWTLIDFGFAAAVGSLTHIGYTLAYAAPEVVSAVRSGERQVIATVQLDLWSLGVMALELLTNEAPLDATLAADEVMDLITGVKPLPWEDPKTASALMCRFGDVWIAVQGLLHRDPQLRPSIGAFRQQCRRILMPGENRSTP